MHTALEGDRTLEHLEDPTLLVRARIQELTEVASLLTSTFDIGQILSNLMDIALRMADAEVGSLWLDESGLRPKVTWGLEEDALAQVRLAGDETVPAHVIRTGELFWSPRCKADPRIMHLPLVVEVESVLGIPLQHTGRAIGCLIIVNRAESELGPDDQEGLKALASFASVAIENARLHALALEKKAMERELGIARQVQLALLPASDPQDWGIQWSSAYFPMGKVGGDYYDYVRSPGNRHGVVVADVSDKGVPAALFMAATRNLVRREAAQLSDPAEVVSRVNRALCDDTERYASVFVTLFYGQFDPADRSFEFVNAGHTQPLWLPRQGEPVWLTARGTVLGQFDDAIYRSGRVILSPGDLLVLYTDGVTEAQSADGALFRTERLLEVVRRSRGLDARPLALEIVRAVREFSGTRGASDDLTVVVGRVQ